MRKDENKEKRGDEKRGGEMNCLLLATFDGLFSIYLLGLNPNLQISTFDFKNVTELHVSYDSITSYSGHSGS